jgi:CRISPR-associated protein Cst2
MGMKIGLNPNIFETEIHSGIYKGSILIELDRVGLETRLKKDSKIRELETIDLVNNAEKAKRILTFIDAFRTMWSSGRQTRFLADISPKFLAAAFMKSKNPIFLEAVDVDKNGQIEVEKLNTVLNDYEKFIEKSVFAVQESIFEKKEGLISLSEGFEEIETWVKEYYGIK